MLMVVVKLQLIYDIELRAWILKPNFLGLNPGNLYSLRQFLHLFNRTITVSTLQVAGKIKGINLCKYKVFVQNSIFYRVSTQDVLLLISSITIIVIRSSLTYRSVERPLLNIRDLNSIISIIQSLQLLKMTLPLHVYIFNFYFIHFINIYLPSIYYVSNTVLDVVHCNFSKSIHVHLYLFHSKIMPDCF